MANTTEEKGFLFFFLFSFLFVKIEGPDELNEKFRTDKELEFSGSSMLAAQGGRH